MLMLEVGLVLFLNIEGFIDTTVVSIALSRNHIPTLIVDVYYYPLEKKEERKNNDLLYSFTI